MSERTIFMAALDIEDPAKRSVYLDESCRGNAELRKRIEALLRSQEVAAGFLNSPPPGIEVSDTSLGAEAPGNVIGPYRLLEQIGEGAFGVVFMAEQTTPVRRKVALKIIKPGMDSRQVIGRFGAERQALALMDHPNIAKVHDAGATESGRPYFVMELVQGIPITEYCDQCNLTTRERLELFITVCQAVQHAHQKGVIHRDIKPTNVLVAMQDGRPAPKVIDFGVAKAIGERLSERTLTTAFAQMVGTPLYMSPEQAELSPLGVDTRSDIYSLGVVLYELLTGTTPLDKDRVHAASYDELRRIIRNEEPPRPSTRLSTLAAGVADTVADHRRIDRRRLSQTVRGDLDWIAMKCLEKDRNRRYDTAIGLARDVERYLGDEPVLACPPAASYRARKFVRRHKVGVASVVLLAIALASLAVSNLLIRSALGEKKAALALALRNEQRATTEGARAKAVSDLLQELFASSNPDQSKGAEYTVRELLDDFSANLGDHLAGQPEVEAAIRSVVGNSYWRLGVLGPAELHLKRALDLRRQAFGSKDAPVADSLVDYAWSIEEQTRHAEAEAHVREALSIYRSHDSNLRSRLRALWTLQRILIAQKRHDAAEEIARDALALAGVAGDIPVVANILHALADTKAAQGKHAEAERYARQSVDLHRRLHGDHNPETAWGLVSLGRALRTQQRPSEAKPLLKEAISIFREHYTLEHNSLQTAIEELRAVLEAEADRTSLDELTSEEAEMARRADPAGDHLRLAALLLASPERSDAANEVSRQLIRRAIEEYGQVAVDAPTHVTRRLMAAEGQVSVIRICAQHPHLAGELEEVNLRLKTELPALLEAFPGSRDCQWQTALIYSTWSAALPWTLAYLPDAQHACRVEIAILEREACADSPHAKTQHVLADAHAWLADILVRSGQPQEAESEYRRAIKICDDHEAVFLADPTATLVLTHACCHTT